MIFRWTITAERMVILFKTSMCLKLKQNCDTKLPFKYQPKSYVSWRLVVDTLGHYVEKKIFYPRVIDRGVCV